MWWAQPSLKPCLSHPIDREARVSSRCGVGVVEGIFHARKEEDARIHKGRERVPQADAKLMSQCGGPQDS